MKNFTIFPFMISFAIFFSSCGNNNSALNEKPAEEQHETHIQANTTTLTIEQMESIKIEFGNIEKKQLTAALKANGLLRVPNNNRANATPLQGGVVTSILVQTGNAVNKGQVIATIANTAFIVMQEEYISVSAKENFAQLEYNRQKELQQGNAGVLKNLQSSEAELSILKVRKASLKKQLELLGINVASLKSDNIQSTINISSPIRGAVSNIMVNIGSYAEVNSPIAEIVDNSQLHLDLYVYEKDLQKLKVGQTIHFTLTNNPGKEYDADVYAISNTFEEHTKAIAVHALVKGNKQGLIDGMSITALVSLENATVAAVPTNAIVHQEGQDYIVVAVKENIDKGSYMKKEISHSRNGESLSNNRDANNNKKNMIFEKIPVRKGTTDIGYSEIALLKEIPPKSRVVVNGAFFIVSRMNNSNESHQH